MYIGQSRSCRFLLARVGTLEVIKCFPCLLYAAVKVSSFDGFINLTFYISLYGGDDLFGIACLCFREAKVIDSGHCFTGEAEGECLYLICLSLLVQA